MNQFQFDSLDTQNLNVIFSKCGLIQNYSDTINTT